MANRLWPQEIQRVRALVSQHPSSTAGFQDDSASAQRVKADNRERPHGKL